MKVTFDIDLCRLTLLYFCLKCFVAKIEIIKRGTHSTGTCNTGEKVNLSPLAYPD